MRRSNGNTTIICFPQWRKLIANCAELEIIQFMKRACKTGLWLMIKAFYWSPVVVLVAIMGKSIKFSM